MSIISESDSALVSIIVNSQALVQTHLDENTPVWTVIQGHVITSDEEYQEAADYLVIFKTKFNELEAIRTEHVKPLNTVVRGVNDVFKPATMMLKEMEARLKASMSAYALRKQAAQRALLAAAAEAAMAEIAAARVTDPPDVSDAPSEAMTLIREAQSAGPQKVEGISTSSVWKWNFVNEGEVPAKYWSVDSRKIDAAVKAGIRDIPGVNIVEDIRIIARAR